MRTHLVFPMGGAGSRFSETGIDLPKPLIEIHGKPFFYWAVVSLIIDIKDYDLSFVVLKEHIDKNRIDKEIIGYFPKANINIIEKVLPGPVFTSMVGCNDIDDDYPIIFNDCDHLFRCRNISCEIEEMASSGNIAGELLTFQADQSQFSYVEFDAVGNVIGTREKQVVSNHAICGAYVYRSAQIFKKMAELYKDNCPYSECFMSGVYNTMIEHGYKVRVCPLNFHLEFGTPAEYEQAKISSLFSEFEGL